LGFCVRGTGKGVLACRGQAGNLSEEDGGNDAVVGVKCV